MTTTDHEPVTVTLATLRAERDRARAWAVRLEQENASLQADNDEGRAWYVEDMVRAGQEIERLTAREDEARAILAALLSAVSGTTYDDARAAAHKWIAGTEVAS